MEKTTLTFLFADMEGSTRLIQDLGDGYLPLLLEYHSRIRKSVEDHGGRSVGTEGDGYFASFATASDGFAAAIEAQRALAEGAWPSGVQVRARMGLHIGDASESAEGLVGVDIHRAARIAAAAHGGQVLVSAAIQRLVGGALPAGVELRDLGEHQLKDLSAPERIFQLVIAGIEADFPPIRTLHSHAHNLPIQTTSFVGRDGDVRVVRVLLDSQRLITLTGSGGAGKTRLALQIAAESVDEFADGAWLVEFATLIGTGVAAETAVALRLREEPGRPAIDTVLEYLQSRNVLLVLDNCEHLLEPVAAFVRSVLATAQDVRIITTSREALKVPGEALYPVAPLGLTSQDDQLAPAIQLFAERAALINPGIGVDESNLRDLTLICERLDGIPLAIELAAARLRMLSVRQLAERLDDIFKVLGGSTRSGMPQHRTLRATIDWSYDLLGERGQLHLNALSVFDDGFSLEAVEDVCGRMEGGEDAFEVLGDLIDASLVQTEHGEDTRYRLLETIRQYGAERLAEDGDLRDELQRRHADHFLHVARAGAEGLRGTDYRRWVDKLDREAGNFRAAIRWSLIRHEIATGMGLGAALTRFWYREGRWSEATEWLDALLGEDPQEGTADFANVLRWRTGLASGAGDLAAANELAERASAAAEAAGGGELLAKAYNVEADLAWRSARLHDAAELYRAALGLLAESDDPQLLLVLSNLAFLLLENGDVLEAERLAHELALACRKLGADERNHLPRLRGEIAFFKGELPEAERQWSDALVAAELRSFRPLEVRAHHDLAMVALVAQDNELARSRGERALELGREIPDKSLTSRILTILGRLAVASGYLEEAERRFEAAIDLATQARSSQGLILAILGAARGRTEKGELELAALLIGAADEAIGGLEFVLPGPLAAVFSHEA